ncbi:hypothetical protein KIW84_024636 [Lathyrus oleraceus]|uniref:DEAD/DEAH-box helicase domain-containing protein n=1 Tax=Pisum sativum TaxID=3888 RepID=A0A9D4YKN5_PEA|nr:hypothetical protein KIW84_024636 [Pisum sativum]
MDGPPDAKDLQPFVLSDIQASNPDVRAVRKAWLKVNLKEERRGKAQELEDSNKRARLLEDQKDDLDHILLGSTSVIRTRKEELKKAEYRICELGRLLDKSLMDKKEIKLDFEAQIRDLRDALKKCEENLSREILQKEEAERNCHHLRYQLEEATRRFAVLESQEGKALVDMYMKCSCSTSNAVKAFRGTASPNVISWTSLTAGFTENGLEEESFQLFAEMRAAGVQPNSFTLSTILGACNKMRNLTSLNWSYALSRLKRHHSSDSRTLHQWPVLSYDCCSIKTKTVTEVGLKRRATSKATQLWPCKDQTKSRQSIPQNQRKNQKEMLHVVHIRLQFWFPKQHSNSSKALHQVPTTDYAMLSNLRVGDNLKIQIVVTTGGTSLKEDIMHLHQPVHLLVGTAGRIPDLTKKGVCILKHCSMLVLYEADKLLSPEFQPLIQELSHFSSNKPPTRY